MSVIDYGLVPDLALASEQSYKYGNVELSGYLHKEEINDTSTGFHLHVWQKEGTEEYVIAFTGTEASAQDAYTDLNLGFTQWTADNSASVFNVIKKYSNNPEAKIHFTGHSLGGALAQYAAYEYAQAVEINAGSSAYQASFDLVTFNALGGVMGLSEPLLYTGTYDQNVSNTISAVHYVTVNDLVSKLGNDHVGGDVRAIDINDTPLFSHSISYFTGGDSGVAFTSFQYEWAALRNDYFAIDDTVAIASIMSSFGDFDGEYTETEAFFRVIAALSAGIVRADSAQLSELVVAFAGDETTLGATKYLLFTKAAEHAIDVLQDSKVTKKVGNGFAAIGLVSAAMNSFAVDYWEENPDLADKLGMTIESFIQNVSAPAMAFATHYMSLAIEAGMESETYQDAIDFVSSSFEWVVDYFGGNEAYFFGTEGGDVINKSGGTWFADDDNTIFTYAGNDVLVGGEGDDRLHGGSGNDTYIWNTGDGNDTIFEAADNDVDNLIINGKNVRDLKLTKLEGQEGYSLYDGDDKFATVYYSIDNHLILVVHLADQVDPYITLKNFVSGQFGLQIESVTNEGAPDDETTYEVGDGTVAISEAASTGFGNEYDDNSRDVADDKTLIFDAETYFSNLEYFPVVQENPDETTSNILRSYLFDGSDKDDWMQGGDWEQEQAAAISDSNHVEEYVVKNSSNDFYGDILNGKGGNDVIIGDKGIFGDDDILIGGIGSDQLIGGKGNDVLFGAETYWGWIQSQSNSSLDRNDLTDDANGVDEVLSAGDFEIQGDQDYLDGGDGDDSLYGGSYSDFILGGDGADKIFGGVGTDSIISGDKNDVVFGDSKFAIIESGEDGGSFYGDFITPDLGYHLYDPSKFNASTDYNDEIEAGAGDDIVFGEIGDDIIRGGEGSDRLQGDRTNSVAFHSADAAFYRDLAYQFNGHVYHGDDYIDGGVGIDYIDGNGGDDVIYGGDETVVNDGGIIQGDVIRGDDDTLSGEFHGNDTIYGGAGNDLIEGNGGDDTISGDEGDDVIYGDWDKGKIVYTNTQDDIIALADQYHGDDKIDGGIGDDIIYGGGGNDTIKGGDGQDSLYGGAGDDTILGGEGGDFLVSGAGEDTLDGGADGDVYILSEGVKHVTLDGHDQIVLDSDKADIKINIEGAEQSTLKLAKYKDHFILIVNNANQLAVESAALNNVTLQLDDIPSLNLNTFVEAYPEDAYVDLPAPPVLFERGSSYSLGGLLDDVLVGDHNHDVLAGYAGNDRLIGNSGSDTLIGGEDNDYLDGGLGNDLLIGGDGNDTLDGGFGSDTLYSGTGEDTLDGGYGKDFYILDQGIKHFSLKALSGGDQLIVTHEDTDVQLSVIGKNSTDLSWGQNDNYYVLFYSESDYLLIDKNDAKTVTLLFEAGVTLALTDFLEGAAGQQVPESTLIPDAVLLDAVPVDGTPEADTIHGHGDLNDTLSGLAGEDTLYGYAGNDTLNGGAENDTLYGGVGSDVLNGGEGDDTLDPGAGNDELDIYDGTDTVIFAEGYGQNALDISSDASAILQMDSIERNQLSVDYNPYENSYTLSINDDDRIVVNASDIDSVQINFSDYQGVSLINHIANVVSHHADAEGSDITGTDYNDHFYSAGGADTFSGGVGNDSYYLTDPAIQTVMESPDEGEDTLVIDNAEGSYDLNDFSNVENIVVNGPNALGSLSITGSSLDNHVNGEQMLDEYHYDALSGGNDIVRNTQGANIYIDNVGALENSPTMSSVDDMLVIDFGDGNSLSVVNEQLGGIYFDGSSIALEEFTLSGYGSAANSSGNDVLSIDGNFSGASVFSNHYSIGDGYLFLDGDFFNASEDFTITVTMEKYEGQFPEFFNVSLGMDYAQGLSISNPPKLIINDGVGGYTNTNADVEINATGMENGVYSLSGEYSLITDGGGEDYLWLSGYGNYNVSRVGNDLRIQGGTEDGRHQAVIKDWFVYTDGPVIETEEVTRTREVTETVTTSGLSGSIGGAPVTEDPVINDILAISNNYGDILNGSGQLSSSVEQVTRTETYTETITTVVYPGSQIEHITFGYSWQYALSPDEMSALVGHIYSSNTAPVAPDIVLTAEGVRNGGEYGDIAISRQFFDIFGMRDAENDLVTLSDIRNMQNIRVAHVDKDNIYLDILNPFLESTFEYQLTDGQLTSDYAVMSYGTSVQAPQDGINFNGLDYVEFVESNTYSPPGHIFIPFQASDFAFGVEDVFIVDEITNIQNGELVATMEYGYYINYIDPHQPISFDYTLTADGYVQEYQGAVMSPIHSGTDNDDFMSGTQGDDILYGFGGADVINSVSGNDLIFGGAGNDEIYAGNGDNQVYGDAGNDSIGVGYGSSTVHGGDGNDSIGTYGGSNNIFFGEAGADYLSTYYGSSNVFHGGDGSDTLYTYSGSYNTFNGGAGNDSLEGYGGYGNTFNGGSGDDSLSSFSASESSFYGGSGDDVYRFSPYTGSNVINNYDAGDGFDVIDVYALDITDVSFTREEDNLIIHLGAETLTVENHFVDVGSVDNALYAIDQINVHVQSSLYSWSKADLESMLAPNLYDKEINGTSGNNTLTGSDGDDLISAGEGHDVVDGGAGNDTIVGGTGNDTLRGGAGDDTFIVEGTDQGTDRILGGDGVDTIQGGGGDDTIALSALLASDSVEVIDGGTGTNTVTGTSGNNTLDFSNTTLTNIAAIDAGAGHDNVTGSAGNNTIVGGTGNDTLRGGAGNDTFVFASGDGVDTIHNAGHIDDAVDLLAFEDIDYQDLWFSQSGNDLVIDVVGTADQVVIDDWYADSNEQLDQITSADGGVLNTVAVDQLVSAMAAFDVPDGVGAVVPNDTRQQLEPVLADTWS